MGMCSKVYLFKLCGYVSAVGALAHIHDIFPYAYNAEYFAGMECSFCVYCCRPADLAVIYPPHTIRAEEGGFAALLPLLHIFYVFQFMAAATAFETGVYAFVTI